MKKIAMLIAASAVAAMAGQALAQDATQRGPVPFSAWDVNNDGYISKEEFETLRKKRQAARKAEGGLLRNQANAPAFESIDANGDGKISMQEFTAHQQKMMQQRPGRGMGMGPGQGRGPGYGMGRKMMQQQQQ